MQGIGFAIFAQFKPPLVVAMCAEVPWRHMEVFHLFSGPERHGDFAHWFKILAGAEGIIASVTNVGYLVSSSRYGKGDLTNPDLCDRILNDLKSGV